MLLHDTKIVLPPSAIARLFLAYESYAEGQYQAKPPEWEILACYDENDR